MRTCTFKGHENLKIIYFCNEQTCDQNRLFCSQCLLNNVHKHNHENNFHIYDSQRFSEKVSNEARKLIEQIKSQIQQNKIKVLDMMAMVQEIQKQLQIICMTAKQVIEQLLNNSDIQQLEFYLLKLQSTKLNQMEDSLFNELINIQQYQINTKLNKELDRQSGNLVEKVIKIKQLSEKFIYQDQNQILGQLQKLEYKFIKLEESDQNLYSSTISNDLKYIISGGSAELLKIWSYTNHSLIRQYKLDNWIFITKFTCDNKFLFVGTGGGTLYQFDVDNQFIQSLKLQIHKDSIYNLYCITNFEILTSSFDQTIIKTDILNKQQLLQICAHNERIDGLDYNKYRDLIVSCSIDKSIKLWNCNNGRLVIEKQNAHNNSKLYQVLFMQNQDQLLSLDNNKQIHLWQIHIEDKQIKLISTISEQIQIYNMSLVLEQQYLILVCDQFIKVYSKFGQCINQIQHNVKGHEQTYVTEFDQVHYYSWKKSIKDMPSRLLKLINDYYTFYLLKIQQNFLESRIQFIRDLISPDSFSHNIWCFKQFIGYISLFDLKSLDKNMRINVCSINLSKISYFRNYNKLNFLQNFDGNTYCIDIMLCPHASRRVYHCQIQL